MKHRTTIAELLEAKRQGRRIVAVSCYDYTTARLVAQSPTDLILVGDSAAEVMLGHDSTLPATMDFMLAITDAVRRGAPDLYLVADMPFLSYHASISEAVHNAGRFLREAGAQMVKIEATEAYLDTIGAVTDAGIPVMGHVGIRPQRIAMTGRLRADGTTAETALEVIELSRRIMEAGASALLVEGTATEVARIVAERCEGPVVSCGSGAGCDGQILIAPDILGLGLEPGPKFTTRYAELGRQAVEAFARYAEDVKAGRFPDDERSYHMKPGEHERLTELLGRTA